MKSLILTSIVLSGLVSPVVYGASRDYVFSKIERIELFKEGSLLLARGTDDIGNKINYRLDGKIVDRCLKLALFAKTNRNLKFSITVDVNNGTSCSLVDKN